MPDINSNVTLIGVPLDLGAENLGVEKGPQAFRDQGMASKLAGVGFKVESLPDIEVKPRSDLEVGSQKLRYLDEIVRVNEDLANRVDELIRSHNRVLVLGGDHSVNLGAVSGASAALDGNLGLIYFDAHGDMNTDQTTLSGNIHG